MTIYNGSNRDDNLVGSAASETFNAGEGNNKVAAGEGHNIVNAGNGSDVITAGAGNDIVNAGGGNNVVDAGGGANIVTAGSGNDTIRTGSGNDLIYAGDGANSIQAGGGHNGIYSGSGADVIETGGGNDLVFSGDGADRLALGGGNDIVFMGGGNDVIRHVISENAGDCDDYWAEGGTDTLQLVLTAAQTRDPAILADIQRFRTHLSRPFEWMFEFRAFNLTARQFERLEIAAPVEANDDSATVGEDGQVSLAVLANDTDLLAADNSALKVVSFDASSVPGTVTLTGNTFTYVPGAAFQHLAAGQTATVSFTYTVADNQGFTDTATVTITVVGSNDAPTAVVDFASGREDGPALSGSVATNDSGGPGAILTYTLVDPVEGLTLAADGNWTFDTTAAAYQSLAEGEVKTIVATYKVSDQNGASAQSTLTITLVGANDTPRVSSVVSAAATEDGAAVSLDALAHASDVDGGAVLTVVDVQADLPPGVSYDAATARFSLDPANAAFQSLAAGDIRVVTVTYGVSDGRAVTPATASWTVTGTNDAPVITPGIVTGAVTGNAVPPAPAGYVTFDDPDTGGVPVASSSLVSLQAVGSDGTPFTLTAAQTQALTEAFRISSTPGSGQAGTVNWSYPVGNGALAFLGAGETATIVFAITVTDEAGASASQNVTITLNGVNDAPVVADPGRIPAIEDGDPVVVSALARASDPDHDTILSVVNVQRVLPPGVTYDAATQSFTLDPGHAAYQSLEAGAQRVVGVTYSVSDGITTTPATIRWTVTGTHDGPTVGAMAREGWGEASDFSAVQASDGDVGSDIVAGTDGDDIFVFRAGETDGDMLLDFNGFAEGGGDTIRFEGFGADATFSKIDDTQWKVTYDGGAASEVITFANAPAIDPTSWQFV